MFVPMTASHEVYTGGHGVGSWAQYDHDIAHSHVTDQMTEHTDTCQNDSHKDSDYTYRLPSLQLLAEGFAARTAVQGVQILLTPGTSFMQFLASTGISLGTLAVEQSVVRGINLLHSDEILKNKMPPFNYTVIPNMNIRDRSIVGTMIQNVGVNISSVILTNNIVGGVPVSATASGVGGALGGFIGTSLCWRSGLANDDLLAHTVPNRNQVMARTILVNNMSSVLSCMASGAFQGFVIGGPHGVIPGSLAGLAGLLLDNCIEIPRTLLSHYIEWLRGQAKSLPETSEEDLKAMEDYIYEFYGVYQKLAEEVEPKSSERVLPELNLEGPIDLDLEDAALIAQNYQDKDSMFIRV